MNQPSKGLQVPPGTFRKVSRRLPGHQAVIKINLIGPFSKQRPDMELARVLSCITSSFNPKFMESDRKLPGMPKRQTKNWRESCPAFYIISDMI